MLDKFKENFPNESGEVSASGLIKVGLICLAGALLVSYGVETFDQVFNCGQHDPFVVLYQFVEHTIKIQLPINHYAESFFVGAFGKLRILSVQVAFCLK